MNQPNNALPSVAALPMTRWQAAQERFLTWLGGDARRNCECCGSANTSRGCYSRGENHLRQPLGGMGFACRQCQHITFDVPLAEYRKGLSLWHEVYR